MFARRCVYVHKRPQRFATVRNRPRDCYMAVPMVKGSLGGETSVLRTFRMSGKELVKERVSKERVSQRKS